MEFVERIGQGIFELEQEIGRGGGATVWKAIETEEPRRPVAVKLVTYSESEYQEKRAGIEDLFAREARTWAEFQRSPYVVQLYRTFVQRVRASGGIQYALGFLMEFSPEGDLRKAIAGKRLGFPKEALVGFLLDIARGLKEGHDKDIIHRDIKASNVLLFKEIPNRLCPKLMDFGLSITTTKVDSRLVGTPEYMAPEVFDNPRQSSKISDVYSLGILFYEICCSKLPFTFATTNKDERLRLYKQAHQERDIDLEEVRKHYENDLWKIMSQMLQKSPHKRCPLNRVIAQLEKMQLADVVESLKSTPEALRSKQDRYVWHPKIHFSVGEALSYFIIRGSSFKGDPTWLMNNLVERGFHGFSIYTILGGHDYVLRIWYPRDSKDDLERVMRDFCDFHNGSFLRFNCRSVLLLRGKAPPKSLPDGADVASELAKCFNGDPATELKQLRRKGFVIGPIDGARVRAAQLRFFLTVNVGGRTEPFLVAAYANEFARRMQESDRKNSLSVYEGDGDFQILLKFRLKRFEEFSRVFETFLTTKAIIQRDDSLITSRTFIEFGDKPIVESDDGLIVAEMAHDY